MKKVIKYICALMAFLISAIAGSVLAKLAGSSEFMCGATCIIAGRAAFDIVLRCFKM